MLVGLQAELRNREMHDAVFVRFETVPLDEDIEGCHRPSQTHLEVAPHAMHRFLKVITERQHRQHSFNLGLTQKAKNPDN